MAAPDQPHAYFDLDGTLSPWDTQLLFCNHILRRQRWRVLLLFPFFCLVPLGALRIVRSRGMKRLFLSYLTGMPKERLEAHAEEFARAVVRSEVWPEMREEIEARRREGCLLVLNTASPGFYAEPIARALGFDRCFATRVVVPARFSFCPAIDGPNNKRAAKIDAMRAAGLIGPGEPMPRPGSWAYTDSHVDLPLLESAENGRLVHPAGAFAARAAERGWKILHPSPAVPRPAWWRAALLMMLGFWKSPMRR